jgi:hypothetical protein
MPKKAPRYKDVGVQLHAFLTLSGQVHTKTTLSLGEESLISIEQEAAGAPRTSLDDLDKRKILDAR